MPNNIEAIENATASLEMEGFSVTDQDKQWCEKLLNKSLPSKQAISKILDKQCIFHRNVL